MKKICILIFTLMSSILGFSQLLEVKGVETKLDVYDGKIYANNETKWFGYSFYNMNGFHVSVEAELYMVYIKSKINTYVLDAILIDTKTFNLKPYETYIWKQEYESDFKEYYREYPRGEYNSEGNAIRYYVKYKAYKRE